jgi:SET domain-containing protein
MTKTPKTSAKKSSSQTSVKNAVKTATRGAVKKKIAAPRKAASIPIIKKPSGRMSNRKAIVRESPIHGRGVVARIAISAGERICEYVGTRIGWPEALRRHPHDPLQPFHTFYFSVDDDTVIDGNDGGDFSRFMNHSCDPNCEADMVEAKGLTRIYIVALRDISPGEELLYNYGLTLEERYTPTLKKQFACHCGSANCRGTMLSPKR